MAFSREKDTPVILVRGLTKRFPLGGAPFGKKRYLHAVNNVRFRVFEGETLGLVGESGCGKSTVGNCLLRLLKPDSGTILYRGQDMLEMAAQKDKRQRLAKIQAVFQDPQSSLDPRMTVEKIVSAPLLPYSGLDRAERHSRVIAMLNEVGLGEDHLKRYPHEFSGGQRQRIGIARALITEPRFVVFDEPTSALDVSVQAQILNLIASLQRKYGYAYLFISHDLAVVRHISRRVAVMYLGHVVETALCGDLFAKPLHPYTRALIDSVPEPDPEKRKKLAVLEGEVPSPVDLPPGCPFAPRCSEAAEVCRREQPGRRRVSEDHFIECHMYPQYELTDD
ncbi:MAG: ABC transporter ATP-binding protein [Mailhella sp.]|nr:ABC transporter ATP-binding protein [Mailhella sp.]